MVSKHPTVLERMDVLKPALTHAEEIGPPPGVANVDHDAMIATMRAELAGLERELEREQVGRSALPPDRPDDARRYWGD